MAKQGNPGTGRAVLMAWWKLVGAVSAILAVLFLFLMLSRLAGLMAEHWMAWIVRQVSG